MLLAKFSRQRKCQHYFLGLCLLGLALLSGCSEHSTDAIPPTDQPSEKQNSLSEPTANLNKVDTARAKNENPALQAFIAVIDQHYETLLTEASLLKEQITQFAISPSDKTRHDSLLAWEQAHNRYLAGRFLDQLFTGLITSELQNQSEQPLLDVHKRLDAYPLLPGYLDAVQGYPLSGLIHTEIPLTLATLYQEFQLGDAAYVTLGFHALEVMLKGTDKERKVTDFEALKTLQDTSKASPALRRTLYCSLLAEQIQEDIKTLPTQWQQGMQAILYNLDVEQTKSLKSRLTKTLHQQATKSDETTEENKHQTESTEHKSELALTMEQNLRQALLETLKSPQ